MPRVHSSVAEPDRTTYYVTNSRNIVHAGLWVAPLARSFPLSPGHHGSRRAHSTLTRFCTRSVKSSSRALAPRKQHFKATASSHECCRRYNLGMGLPLRLCQSTEEPYRCCEQFGVPRRYSSSSCMCLAPTRCVQGAPLLRLPSFWRSTLIE